MSDEKVPQNMRDIYNTITTITDKVCHEKLSTEYAVLAHRLTGTLCRKKPSPIANKGIDSWACGIVYALGAVNFLFDKSFEPYLNAAELCAAFNVSKSTGSDKANQIKKALKMHQMDPKWCLPSLMDKNPLLWLIMVDGLIVDARKMPRETQEIAFKKGLIPHIPKIFQEEL